jgi:hypothetical protein
MSPTIEDDGDNSSSVPIPKISNSIKKYNFKG